MFNLDFTPALEWASSHMYELVITLVIICVYIALDLMTAPQLEAGAEKGKLKGAGAKRAVGLARRLGIIISLLLLAVVWGVQLSAVFVLATTTLTLLGVALFAQWSILSNITAYFILTLHPSFARGNYIRILDGDNYAEGYIADLNLFSTKLITDTREIILYPNILVLGRPTQINPNAHLNGIGKVGGAEKDAQKEEKPGVAAL